MPISDRFVAAQHIYRGTTVQFASTFYDANGVITTPFGAIVNIIYALAGSNAITTVQINMSPPVNPSTNWTAQWDSRGANAGTVAWSIHTTSSLDDPPFSVEDGIFDLEANNANLVTF